MTPVCGGVGVACWSHPAAAHSIAASAPADCSVQDCAILNQCLEEVAKQYPATKFVKVVSTGGWWRCAAFLSAHPWQHWQLQVQRSRLPTSHAEPLAHHLAVPASPPQLLSAECIPGYPDENLPTVLLYKDTKCVQSLVGLRQFGGRSTSPELLAISLNRHGEVCGDAEQQEQQVRSLVSRLLLREEEARQAGGGGDDDE